MTTEFVNSVIDRAKQYVSNKQDQFLKWSYANNVEYIDPDWDSLTRYAAKLEEYKFSFADAFALLRYCEEVDPTVPEDIALLNIRLIEQKYK